MTTFTANVGLVADATGSNVGTWADNVTNLDFIAIDGLLAGVQTISVASTPVTLTSPTTFTPTPGGGPKQSQNRVLRFTGALTANVVITLPTPGAYIIENLTTGAFVLSFRGVTATEVIGTPQGERVNIYNDGANVRFVGLARMGTMEMWSGISTVPAWVAACTIKPYLYCDGSTHNISDFPFLGARYGSTFGGNGLTTFGVPNMGGRVPLQYDDTGNRITVAGCGINGQTLGATNTNAQSVTLAANQIPSLTSINAAQAISVAFGGRYISASSNPQANVPVPTTGGVAARYAPSGAGDWADITTASANNSISVAYTNASQQVVNNVQPAMVTGIWMVAT